MRHVPSFLCLALGFALSFPAWGGSGDCVQADFGVTMPKVPDHLLLNVHPPVRDGETKVHVLPYMPPPGAWPQGFIRTTADAGERWPEVQEVYFTVHNERGEIKWHAVVEIPRGETRGVTMAHLAGTAEDKDFVRAEAIPDVEATDSYSVYVETLPTSSVLGMSRSSDGFLVDLGKCAEIERRYQVAGYTSHPGVLMNPGRNRRTVGLLRLANPMGAGTARVVIEAGDDGAFDLCRWLGRDRASEGCAVNRPDVSCAIPPRQAFLVDVADLEKGGEVLDHASKGRCEGEGLGEGKGKWSVIVLSNVNRPFAVQAFLRSSTGLMSNVSQSLGGYALYR